MGIRNVSDWKVEAKNETSIDYFVRFPLVDRLVDGSRCFVVGRRGTGKTAIASYIDSKYRSSIVNFDSFPFQTLFKFKDEDFSSNSEYISVWKNLIYHQTLKYLFHKKELPSDVAANLDSVFGDYSKLSTFDSVDKWKKFSFGVNILGVDVKSSAERESTDKVIDIRRANENIERLLSDTAFSPVFILIDEIDEDFSSKLQYREAFNRLMAGLLKAVQEVKTKLRNKIIPIVFLREDIYWELKDTSKSKWIDFIIKPEWKIETIKQIVTHRLSLAYDYEFKDFQEAWKTFCAPENIVFGSKRTLHSFSYIGQFTQGRPREYIQFMKILAEAAYQSGASQIVGDDFKREIFKFSQQMTTEYESEIEFKFAHAERVLTAIREMRRMDIRYGDFRRELGLQKAARDEKEAIDICHFLYKIGVFGHKYHSEKTVFISDRPGSEFDMKAPIFVHRSVHSYLGLA